jgi:WD40 repeat protein
MDLKAISGALLVLEVDNKVMRHYIKIAWLIPLSFWLIACGTNRIPLVKEPPTPSVMPIHNDQVIVPENTTSLAEVTQLSTDGAGPVAAMIFTPDMQTLLAVYAHEGVLRHWRLQDDVLVHVFDTYPVELGATAFDATGSKLATAAGWAWKLHKSDIDYIGSRVWETQTGTLILRNVQQHIPPGTLDGISIVIDVALSPDGKWLLTSEASADEYVTFFKHFFQVEVATGRLGTHLVDFSRQPEEDDFDVITFDFQGEFFVAAGESGEVDIFRFQAPEYPAKPYETIEEPGQLGDRPLALAFDQQRRWLARVRGNALTVWDLQSNRFKRQLEAGTGETIGPTASLAFNPSGTLLGVGTANGWQIWDLEKQELLVEDTDTEVYAITFSPDGRLFAWGDASGVVHIWGIP